MLLISCDLLQRLHREPLEAYLIKEWNQRLLRWKAPQFHFLLYIASDFDILRIYLHCARRFSIQSMLRSILKGTKSI